MPPFCFCGRGVKLWKHPNGTYYVLFGQRLRQRISTHTKDKNQAQKFWSTMVLSAARSRTHRDIEKCKAPCAPVNLAERNTVGSVAAYWACSPNAVRRLIKDGTLSCLRLGKVIRITRDQVVDCEERCTETAMGVHEWYGALAARTTAPARTPGELMRKIVTQSKLPPFKPPSF